MLALAHLALTALLVVWDIALAGRIAQWRKAPPALAAITGLAGFLVAPALIITLATSSALAGGAALRMDWLWPFTLLLCAIQASYAVMRRLVNPLVGIPIAFYDLILVSAEFVRYAAAHGAPLSAIQLTPLGAERGALAVALGASAFGIPLFLLAPIIAPTLPALNRAMAGVRTALAVLSIAWAGLWMVQLVPAYAGLASYARHDNDRLRERPAGDLAIGLALLPDIGPAPSATVLHSDIALADSLNVDAIALRVTIDATATALDSVARAVDDLRRTNTPLVVTLGDHDNLFTPWRSPSRPDAARLDAVRRVVRHLHPDILFLTSGPEARTWRDYLERASALAKREDSTVRVGVEISSFSAGDSALYAWTVSRGSPMDLVGVTIHPSRDGGRAVDADCDALDRWLLANLTTKDHWVFTSGYPGAHGERNQARGIWAALAWASNRRVVKGVVVRAATDYWETIGVRSPSGHLRLAAYAITRAMRGLHDALAPVPPDPSTR